jgi:DNA repair exonuclease SbcCD nuclease subunit
MKTLSNKFFQIKRYCELHDVQAGLISGDIFNSNVGTKIPHDLVTDLIIMLKGLEIPLYGIAGNHDLYLGSLERHPLSSIFGSGVIEPLDESGTKIADNVTLYGWDHKYEKDVDRFNNELVPVNPGFNIGLIHLALGERPGMFYNEPQYGVEEFCESGMDLFLNGHIHTPLGPLTNSKGQIFCQPGALRRTNSASEEITRSPHVTLIRLTSKIEVEYLPIQGPEDVFKNWKRAIQKEKTETVNKFIEKAQSMRTAESQNVIEICDKADLEPEVKSILLEKLK